MLDFAVEHITAINTITADRDMKLRQYELSESDWAIAHQLRDVLKVHSILLFYFISTNYNSISYSRTRHCFFHKVPPTSQLSYQLWTISTNTSPQLPLIADILLQSRLHLQSAKKPSIITTIKLIIPRYIGSRWVCVLLLDDLFSYILLVLYP